MAVGACKTAFTPSTGVQIPLGTPMKNQALTRNREGFFVVGQICPTICPTNLEKSLSAPQGKASRSRGGLHENESGRSGCVLPIHAAGDKFLSAALVIKMWLLVLHPAGRIRIFCTQKTPVGCLSQCFSLWLAVAAFWGIL